MLGGEGRAQIRCYRLLRFLLWYLRYLRIVTRELMLAIPIVRNPKATRSGTITRAAQNMTISTTSGSTIAPLPVAKL